MTMLKLRNNSGLAHRLGLILGCAVLILPPSIGTYVSMPGSGTQPMEEEESRSPVENVKIGVGAVHRQEDRRERPQPQPCTLRMRGHHHAPCQTRSLDTFRVAREFDSHNGIGGPLVV